MTTIMPEGENIRKAVKWISEERKFEPQKKVADLVDIACAKFDLSPMESEYLCRFFKQKDTEEAG